MAYAGEKSPLYTSIMLYCLVHCKLSFDEHVILTQRRRISFLHRKAQVFQGLDPSLRSG